MNFDKFCKDAKMTDADLRKYMMFSTKYNLALSSVIAPSGSPYSKQEVCLSLRKKSGGEELTGTPPPTASFMESFTEILGNAQMGAQAALDAVGTTIQDLGSQASTTFGDAKTYVTKSFGEFKDLHTDADADGYGGVKRQTLVIGAEIGVAITALLALLVMFGPTAWKKIDKEIQKAADKEKDQFSRIQLRGPSSMDSDVGTVRKELLTTFVNPPSILAFDHFGKPRTPQGIQYAIALYGQGLAKKSSPPAPARKISSLKKKSSKKMSPTPKPKSRPVRKTRAATKK